MTSSAASSAIEDSDEPSREGDPEGDGGSDERTKSHTSHSGATKRSRSGGRGKSAKQARPLDSSSGEEEDLLPERKNGRGRPITTGKGVHAAALKEANRTLNALKRQQRDAERVLQGDYHPRQFEGAERRKRVRELEEQIPQLPTRDLVAKVLEHASRADEAARVSKNLKGSLAGAIRDAALYTRVAVDALSTRASGGMSEREEQLREELAALKALVADLLRERNDRDREKMPPPPDPPLAGRDTIPAGETVREEEMPEVTDAELLIDPSPPGKVADPPPPEKKTWEVVTPKAGTSRVPKPGRERSRTRGKERSSSRKRTDPPQSQAKNPPPPSPQAPKKTGKPLLVKAGELTGEMVERRIQEAVDRSQREILQKMEEMFRAFVGGGA
ncbi:PREDICTED: serine/arginine repetitive matrix protein 1-like, partial [Vollenhovia emeryi]|uniref:serine/arginine repetitive matrix protein 1-like n=1 Tax=Vollenhovia emeryi TaxID=411798 RepID=UPI0005F512E0